MKPSAPVRLCKDCRYGDMTDAKLTASVRCTNLTVVRAQRPKSLGSTLPSVSAEYVRAQAGWFRGPCNADGLLWEPRPDPNTQA